MSAVVWHDYDWCSGCGVNPPIVPGALCGSCQADEDFYNCLFCEGTKCTGECEGEDYVGGPSNGH